MIFTSASPALSATTIATTDTRRAVVLAELFGCRLVRLRQTRKEAEGHA